MHRPMNRPMYRPWFGLVLLVVMVSLIGAIAIGCEDKPADAPATAAPAGGSTPAAPAGDVSARVLGTYENAHDKITIELKEGGKATMIDEGKSTDVTWEMDGSDKLVVHGQEGMNLLLRINPDGSLADNMGLGSVFRKK